MLEGIRMMNMDDGDFKKWVMERLAKQAAEFEMEYAVQMAAWNRALVSNLAGDPVGNPIKLQPDGLDRLLVEMRGGRRVISQGLCKDCQYSGDCLREGTEGHCGPNKEQDRLTVDNEWRSGLSAPEPPPASGWGDVAAAVVDDLLERREMGKEKYGRALQFGNERRYERDMYQELMDALIYARGMVAEVETLRNLASLARRDALTAEGHVARLQVRIGEVQGHYERTAAANTILRQQVKRSTDERAACQEQPVEGVSAEQAQARIEGARTVDTQARERIAAFVSETK